MITKRLELALERLQSPDWERFERLASSFLATEFDDLRTVASPSGDGGRDSELFSPHGEPAVVAQYSVTTDWRGKILATVKRLKTTFPQVLVLVYASSKTIGASADTLRKELRTKHGLGLDIRDRTWFCERVMENATRQQAAEELARAVVDPYLADVGVGPRAHAELSSQEAVAAVTFLGLQWRDDVRDKGLTRLAFEALVRSALLDTTVDNRITRTQLLERMQKLLPGHTAAQIRQHVESAVTRLGKGSVKLWPGDELCLAHDEVVKFNEYRVSSALSEAALVDSIKRLCEGAVVARGLPAAHVEAFVRLLRTCVDTVVFERSQAFAMAIQSGSLASLADNDFRSPLTTELNRAPMPKIKGVDWITLLQAGVREILISDVPAIQTYLRSLSDSYTLLAFVRQTPDVQTVVEKMFSHGKLWLDATIVLPLIADTLASADGEKGRFSRMIDAARDAGLKMHVTPGVVEEVERHMNRALTCVRLSWGQWQGSIPYLLERYLSFGRSAASFASWLETFRGESRPLDDLADYLRDEFGISVRSLEEESQAASQELRYALQQIWYERYRRREEKYGTSLDEMAISRLVSHDVECYAGVVKLRSQEGSSPFGYSAWWLTVDRQTFDLKGRLRSMMNEAPPDSPVMSADFLVNYLAFGPLRRNVSKTSESHLPLLMALGGATQLTPELAKEAENVRAQLRDVPERVVRRQVRDHLDRARSTIGPIANLGMDEVDEAVQR